MNFKSHRKQKSFMLASSNRDHRQRRSVDPTHPPPSTEGFLQRAKQLYYAQSDLHEAIALFHKFLQLHPHHDEALYLAGVACLHLDRTEDAIHLLLRISDAYDNHANATLLAAMAYNKLGRTNTSFEMIDGCLEKYPEFQEALCFRGRLHLQRKDYGRAEEDFKAAVGVRKPSFLSYVGLADCCRAMNKNQIAIQLYSKAKEALKLSGSSQRHAQQFYDIELKSGICLYFLQNYVQALSRLRQLIQKQQTKTSQLYYYMGLCEMKLNSKQKGMLNLQYSMRLQTNSGIIKKAFKRLVLCYVQNYQFYQAMNTVKLGEQCGIDLPDWRKTVEAFMLIIKNNHEQGAAALKTVCKNLKEKDKEKSKLKIKKASMHQLHELKDPVKVKLIGQSNKLSFFDSPKSKDYKLVIRSRNTKKRSQFSNKSVEKAIAKIGSAINYKQVTRPVQQSLRYKTQHVANDTALSPKSLDSTPECLFSPREMETLYPIILQFKAYSQFFMSNYVGCLQTYEQYESYIKDMFGRQSDLTYGKLLCQAMLMSETDMPDDALAKYSECIQWHYQRHGELPSEPILYKIVLLIRLAAIKQGVQSESDEEDVASFQEILASTLKMMENYRNAIANHPLAHYFESIIYLMQEKYQLAREALEKTLKLTEECTWKYLYVKGVVEMVMGNYYDGIKEFSAGLILEPKPEFYLCRAICFFLLSEHADDDIDEVSLIALMKSVSISAELSGAKVSKQHPNRWSSRARGDIFLENCFQDLQRYIQLQQDKLQISIWVSRLLFATRSYQQAMSSLQKIPLHNLEMVRLARCIEIYEGEFEEGGDVGLVIKSAFDSKFLETKEEERLLEGAILKNYNSSAFDYLTPEYQKWLVILHLYVRQDYPLLMKYIQRELFAVKSQKNQVLLRYNLCVVYLLLGEGGKAANLAKSLAKFQKDYGLQHIVSKISGVEYEQDECLQQLKQMIGIGANRLLSNYLPYRPVLLLNSLGQQRRVFVRVNIPFPTFPSPNFEVTIDRQFILDNVNANLIEKKIDAPWVRRINNRVIQFTEKLDESELELGQADEQQEQKGKGGKGKDQNIGISKEESERDKATGRQIEEIQKGKQQG